VAGSETTFTDLIAQLNYPMIVVTTASAGQRAGCLVGFHTQCSIEPARFAIWLSKANYSFRVALFADTFAVHALDASNQELATLFGAQTGDDIDKFDHCEWTEGPDGVPLLDDCPNRLISRRIGSFDDGGDHVCVVLEPIRAEGTGPFKPLSSQHVRHLQAGHDVDDRPVPRQHL
jgi:flavin reductase (DIM6/NTAB) family NADH-FMN oxidoreductase RutF